MTVDSVIERDCVIAGGGPAGMVLGYLLARRGLRVTVLEKHGDFLRDFRGDTVHPSTVTLLGELGLREKFLELPLTRLSSLDIVVDGQRITIVDFGTLPAPDNFLVLAPQWDFLNFLARETSAFPTFELRMLTEATGVIIEEGQVRGVRASTSDGGMEIRAHLTVAADGREFCPPCRCRVDSRGLRRADRRAVVQPAQAAGPSARNPRIHICSRHGPYD
jgi:2-polyprenyl-6-methoxyphenol hydroxylase-like FAD-dependent oxidoreductase